MTLQIILYSSMLKCCEDPIMTLLISLKLYGYTTGADTTVTYIPSYCTDFGKNDVHIKQPKSGRFAAKFNNITIEGRMLFNHLILGFMLKMQGITVNHVVSYFGTTLLAADQAYVALIRVFSKSYYCILQMKL